ncbi:hypothetical protein BDZ94DRAFT_1272707 [Collybia nuda]|uniref:Uncharacterized protein n=1 Tax=Collybia nuda TaxID=64659 RepID=A0A9P5XVL9_9AGAR|nr:hypothetical protein BDZ94DRAFT_1272707 [Collybia nuda]
MLGSFNNRQKATTQGYIRGLTTSGRGFIRGYEGYFPSLWLPTLLHHQIALFRKTRRQRYEKALHKGPSEHGRGPFRNTKPIQHISRVRRIVISDLFILIMEVGQGLRGRCNKGVIEIRSRSDRNEGRWGIASVAPRITGRLEALRGSDMAY